MKLGQSDPRNRVTTERTDRAVSPVIGVILMVAITVILAAVIGVFVLGLGDEIGDTTPTADLDISATEVIEDDGTADTFDINGLQIVHTSGDDLNVDDLEFEVADTNGAILHSESYESITDDADAGQGFERGDSHDGVDDLSFVDEEVAPNDRVTIQIYHEPSDSAIASEEFTIQSAD